MEIGLERNVQKLAYEYLNENFPSTELGIQTAVGKFNNILMQAAKNSLRVKTKTRRKRRNFINKKWLIKTVEF